MRFGNPQWNKHIFVFQAYHYPREYRWLGSMNELPELWWAPSDYSGKWRVWDHSGWLIAEFKYDNGRRHGQFWSFFVGGKKCVGEYRYGIPHGKWITYDKEGKERAVGEYRNGKEWKGVFFYIHGPYNDLPICLTTPLVVDDERNPVQVLAALYSKDESIRLGAVRALGKIRVEDKKTILTLLEMLDDDDEYTRDLVVLALGNIGKPAVSPLIKSLRDKNSIVRSNAARTLGEIGAEAKEAIPSLKMALNDSNELVRQAAAKALKQIRGEPTPSTTKKTPHLRKRR